MRYAIDCYLHCPQRNARFALGMRGTRILWAVGLNPSAADDRRPDPTLRKLMGFAERAGFDGFLMANLYPQRTPYPAELHLKADPQLCADNLAALRHALATHPPAAAFAAWGAHIGLRPWLLPQLRALLALPGLAALPWLQTGLPTLGGHPRHPGRAPYAAGLVSFDPHLYLERIFPS
ncbi:MAG: DUF1643 domain-containing protein [Bacteroidia bacterium]|nr:DUF1643 domain-containing protein [Bacteroidia bacterium]